MRRPSLHFWRATLLLVLVVTGSPAAAQVVQEHVGGLRAPAKLLELPQGQLLVAEAGNGPNTGRISMIDRDARRFTVVDGLPSGLHGPRLDPSGPSGLLQSGQRLYVLIGNGDISVPGAAAQSEIVNPAVSSPLFSSVLLLEFSVVTDGLPLGFALPSSAHATIAAGSGVYLHNGRGDSVRVSRLVDFPDYVAEPRPDEPRNIRISNPFGMVGSDSGLAVIDASFNRIWKVATTPGTTSPALLANFAPVPNTGTMGPPLVEAVPAGLRVAGDDFMVSLLTGFPFGAGAASVWRVNRHSGATERIIGGLQTAIDVLPLNSSGTLAYVLEYSLNFLAGGTGRMLQVNADRGTSLVMAAGLRTPTSMARDTRTGDVFVAEFSANRIVRVLIPR